MNVLIAEDQRLQTKTFPKFMNEWVPAHISCHTDNQHYYIEVLEKLREQLGFLSLSHYKRKQSAKLIFALTAAKANRFSRQGIPKFLQSGSRILTEVNKRKRIEVARELHQAYETYGHELFDYVVNGDETWVHYITLERKQQWEVSGNIQSRQSHVSSNEH
ncbi:hypothetical protein TNCV_63781 [Trichonephila clavipes]|nr:hypothetical protein TNCV_63781 [Trichonephila clavipes]